MLTAREHVVLRYLLLGYSSQLIGERLGIAEGTVKIHRWSIHQKLDITSQAELLALFVQCIPMADPQGHVDPLVAFHARRERAAATCPRQFLGQGRDGQAARQEGGPVGDEGTRFGGGRDLHRSALS